MRAEPVIPAGEESVVHHLLVYGCNTLTPEHLSFVGDGYSQMATILLRARLSF